MIDVWKRHLSSVAMFAASAENCSTCSSSVAAHPVLLRIAPHLVSPLPFVIPTYGRGKSSRWFLGTGMLLYDALSADVNRHVVDPARRVGGTGFRSRTATV